MLDRPFLLDVSRLVWRVWRGALPTGIDRVCLEYLAHFGQRSRAVVQFRGKVFVLSPAQSDRLSRILSNPGRHSRAALIAFAAGAWSGARRSLPKREMVYLNAGHTGLHERALASWIAENGVRAVYLVHDLIPITHPQFCRSGEAAKHSLRMSNALASAAGIIGNSQATLDDLAAFAAGQRLEMPPNVPIWLGGHRTSAPVQPTLFERPHFVTLGTIEGRKNHLLLLQIWRRLVASLGADAPLLFVVGQRGWEAEAATAMLDGAADLKGHVRELGTCTDVELQGLLAGARALLMPSLAEGFGLPVIEALQAGAPVIASDLPVYREVVGDIPTYLDPNDTEAWEDAIVAFAGDSPEWERQKRAMEGFAAPDWAGHFAAVERWLGTL